MQGACSAKGSRTEGYSSVEGCRARPTCTDTRSQSARRRDFVAESSHEEDHEASVFLSLLLQPFASQRRELEQDHEASVFLPLLS